MKLSKGKTQLIYNHFLTLAGIQPAAFEYKLGYVVAKYHYIFIVASIDPWHNFY
ncbi:predicted helicase [Candidatus Vecturithrix granuli]|uniref:Predicted helicase n=1 Tax=Vecturithrix granuli TaxID=1499967 RepID=A0A081BY77_VECG1|nr:predicted helicase [Candidatus Vecturithrix granuli]